MTHNKEASKIIFNFARKLFASTPTDLNKKILFEKTESEKLLINGKPSLYKQIINGRK